uniref:Uncharacterized protein n=1 Tax=Rhizophora mucronata TaxID=61149 RepID=A0A2P2NVY5_RHIMU
MTISSFSRARHGLFVSSKAYLPGICI